MPFWDKTSKLPSPPSETAQTCNFKSGLIDNPDFKERPASKEETAPLKESIAINTFINSPSKKAILS